MKEKMGFANAKTLSREGLAKAVGPLAASTFVLTMCWWTVCSISDGRCVLHGNDHVTGDGASDHNMVVTDLELRKG